VSSPGPFPRRTGVIPPISAAPPPLATPREYYGWEIVAVLGVSFGLSGVGALLSFVRTQLTQPGGIGNATIPVISAPAPTTYPWLDLLDRLVEVLNGLAPALLAIVLLLRTFGKPGLGIGLDRLRHREFWGGVGLTAAIGIPGLALLYIGSRLKFNGHIQAVDFPDVWYRIPLLLLDAFQNGAAEEIVVLAFLLTRLRQLGWTNERALIASATLRGSYHLYQGIGGFAGNFVMGAIFGWLFQRTKRVWPFIVAHTLLDAFSFIGYVYLHNHISWL
jgi:membrane protease YdiL (CAAX protease family)